MKRIEELEKGTYATWVVAVLTLVSFVALIPVNLLLVFLIVHMLWPVAIPGQFTTRAFPWLAVSLSLICTYQINVRLRGKVARLPPQCPTCGFDNASATAKFCRSCSRLRVSVFRFFTVGDLIYVLLSSVLLLVSLRKVVPWIMRAYGITWSGQLPVVITHYTILLLVGIYLAQRLKSEIKEQRGVFET